MLVSTEKYLNVASKFLLLTNSLELDCLTKNPSLGNPKALLASELVYHVVTVSVTSMSKSIP